MLDTFSLDVNSSSCPFCREFANVDTSEFRFLFPKEVLQERLIHETHDFCVLACLGAIREGYLLIIPKLHYKAFAHLPEKLIREAEGLKQQSVKITKATFGHNSIVFEHGSVNKVARSGACIDHAHLHIFPTDVDLFQTLSGMFDFVPLNDLRGLLQFHSESYIYYERNEKKGAFLIKENQPSQLMRRLIMEKEGEPDLWDWAANIGKEYILKTVKTLKGKFRNGHQQITG